MKRNIKFRVWDDTKRSWVDKFMITPTGRIEVFLINDPNNLTLQQFTGCYDKNGKEIYEGDIVHYFHDDSYNISNENLVCVYDPSNAWYGFSHSIDDLEDGYYWLEISRYCEVIGNIFDAPHLLSK